MDFEYHYTREQKQFRHEVRAWLEKNVPEKMREPVDPETLSDEQYWFWRGMHKKLAQKGWLYPTYPKEYGGGGLTPEHETILAEELARAGKTSNNPSRLVLPSILVWGSEEQKQKFLVPLLKGESVAVQSFTEPQSGSDLASIRSRAIRDGDDWIITGQKVYIGHSPDDTYLYGPFMTDPEAPRHRNLGYFLIPVPSPGLEFHTQHLLSGTQTHFVFLDNVRVPGDHLIGGDHQGWQVAQTTLEQEHGGRGQAFMQDDALDNLIAYVRKTKHNAVQLGSDPIVQQKTMDAYIDSHIHALFVSRNYWMYQAGQEMSYHGSQSFLCRKLSGLANADRARDIMGLYALLGTEEPRALFKGQPEVYQRSTLVFVHPGGTLEIQKVIIARRIGISRTKERAAPTPATTTGHGS